MNASAQLTLVCWRHSIFNLLNRRERSNLMEEQVKKRKENILLNKIITEHLALSRHKAYLINSMNVNKHEGNRSKSAEKNAS